MRLHLPNHPVAALVPWLVLSLAVPTACGDPAAVVDPRVESIARLEGHIVQREERLAELGRDIVELDARIEKRVDGLVRMLGEMKEGNDPDGKTVKLKQEAIASLKRAMDIYAGKRREVEEKAKAGDAAAEKDLGRFDERIHKRVDQIAELAKSVPAGRSTDPTDYDGASYWNGFFFENTRLSGNEGESGAKAEKDPAKAAAAIARNIDTLDKRRASLLHLLSRRGATEAARKLYARELGKLDASRDHLKERLRGIEMASVAAGRPIDDKQAHDLSQLLDDARSDLREDVARLFRSYDQFARVRMHVSQLKAGLAARKEALEKKQAAGP